MFFCRRVMIVPIILGIISCAVHRALKGTAHEYLLMHYTKLISEENFTPGLPLVIVLPLVEEEKTQEEVGHLIEELHILQRWPILVFNVTYEIEENMNIEIHQHGSYIILISGNCKNFEQFMSGFYTQLLALRQGNVAHSWNPRARFAVIVTSNCTYYENTVISGYFLVVLWLYQVTNAVVLFLKSNEHRVEDLQKNVSASIQDTYLELHSIYPYENSEGCNPADGTVPVKVISVQNLTDTRSNELFYEKFIKNLQGCPLIAVVPISPIVPVFYTIGNKETDYRLQEYGWEEELINIIGVKLNTILYIQNDVTKESPIGVPIILVSSESINLEPHSIMEYTRSYITVTIKWHTPCSIRHQRWSRFFNVFTIGMWICFAPSLVLSVFTVNFISKYGRKSHLHEFMTYRNIISITANMMAVALSVSVNTQPRTAPLRVFFCCWVCFCVAISTVFQAYFSAYLIEPGYEEPIKTVNQMLKSNMKFGFLKGHEKFFMNSSESVDSAILKKAVLCPDYFTCLKWAVENHNISTTNNDLNEEAYRAVGIWIDESNKPRLCELEDGDVTNIRYSMSIINGNPFMEYINDVINGVEEAGIFIKLKRRYFNKLKISAQSFSHSFADTYTDMKLRHMQTVFYILILGYVLALVCFVMEIMWNRLMSKGRVSLNTPISPG